MKVPSWVKENPGAPFIIGFMIELIAAAISLSLGYEDLANDFAEIAYYFLVIGVILQLIAFVIEERRSKGSEREENDLE